MHRGHIQIQTLELCSIKMQAGAGNAESIKKKSASLATARIINMDEFTKKKKNSLIANPLHRSGNLRQLLKVI